MKVDKTVVDDLNIQLTINLAKADYEKDFNKELKKYASKAAMKGFRKGKTPLAVVKKMYGDSVLADVLNTKIQNALYDYIETEKLDIMGNPIPSESQKPLDVSVKELKDYEFVYDCGLAPEVKIKGIAAKDKYEFFKVGIQKDIVEEELEIARKRLGKQEKVDAPIEENDIVTVQAEEMAGKKKEKDGWATEFNVLVSTLADDYKKKVLKLKKNESFEFNIYELEKEQNEEYVKKYLLNFEKPEGEEEWTEPEVGQDFKGEIKEISRLIPAELDEEFFEKYFGKDKVTNEKEAKEQITESLRSHYDKQAEQIMYRNIMDTMVEKTDVPLPEAFLKRWVTAMNEKLTPEQVDAEFEAFLSNTKWSLIKGELAKKFEVKVEPEEVRQAMESKVMSYFGQYGMDPSMIGSVMENMMQNKEEVNKTYEELQAGKIFEEIGGIVAKDEKEITVEKFNEMVKELNAKHQEQ